MNQRKIEVVDYNPAWVNKFEAERNLLQQTIGVVCTNIEHIGSTSVPGLVAKPIIDILLEVSDLHLLDQLNPNMTALSYTPKGENGIDGRRYYQKGGLARSHHIHAFTTGSEHLVRHRAFKHYLIAHPDIAQQYGEIKRQAALNCHHDNNVYMALKNDFIAQHEQLALAWYRANSGDNI